MYAVRLLELSLVRLTRYLNAAVDAAESLSRGLGDSESSSVADDDCDDETDDGDVDIKRRCVCLFLINQSTSIKCGA